MIFLKEFIISSADEARKLDKWLLREMPMVGIGQRQKLFRQKCFKLNGKHVKGDVLLHTGDLLQVYANDACFEKPRRSDPFLSKIHPKLRILYEDAHILLADKRPGLNAHPNAQEKVDTLLTQAQAYLYQKGEYDSLDKSSFAPALCNRIDRFTGGIVIIAKTEEAMHILNQKIRDREIEKYYYCIALGAFPQGEVMLDNYILKPDGAKRVTVVEHAVPKAQRAQTRCKLLCRSKGLSLVECALLTGRTHQIRAQMAHAGHPLLGDNQYGDARRNEKYGRSFQALYAYKLKFAFQTDAGCLNDLCGREFVVPDVSFIREYFPEYKL